MSPQTVTGAGTGWTLDSFKSTPRAISHRFFTSLSANGVPMDNLDSHASKSLYDFSDISESPPPYRTVDGIVGSGVATGDDEVGDDSSDPPLEMDVEATSGSISIFF